MFEHFIPVAGRESYRASPHKGRMDQLAQHLVSLRYRPAVIRQHLREWLRFSTDLVAHQLVVPPDRSAPVVQAYLAHRCVHCESTSRTRVIRASLRIFLEADTQGHFRRRVSTKTIHVVSPWMQVAIDGYLTFLRLHRGLAARTLEKRACVGSCSTKPFVLSFWNQYPMTKSSTIGNVNFRWCEVRPKPPFWHG